MSQRLCPYCDHPNLADAKFCSACGAAMHLAPCPHCGAVNNISSAACYRCHGELPGISAVEDAPAATAAVAVDSLAAVTTAAAPDADVGRSRPSLIVVGIILIAFAAASYYAYRQRSEIGGRDPAAPAQAESTPVTGTISRPDAALTGASKATAADTPAPAVARPEITPVTPARDAPATAPAPVAASENTAETRPRRRSGVAAVTPAELAPATTPADRRSIPLPPAAPIANCTEAIAALGLCKLEPKKP